MRILEWFKNEEDKKDFQALEKQKSVQKESYHSDDSLDSDIKIHELLYKDSGSILDSDNIEHKKIENFESKDWNKRLRELEKQRTERYKYILSNQLEAVSDPELLKLSKEINEIYEKNDVFIKKGAQKDKVSDMKNQNPELN